MKGRKVFTLDDGNLPPRRLMSCSKKIYSEQHCETSESEKHISQHINESESW